MDEPTILTRPRWCPRCDARMRITDNPYYGVGLAVHRYLSSCRRCGFVEFLPPPPHRGEDQDLVEAPGERRGWRRMRQRVGRLLTRRK
jgi:ribosomal protein S27AE